MEYKYFDIMKEFLRRARCFLIWFRVRYIEWAPNTTENMSATNTVFNGFEQFVFPLEHDQNECGRITELYHIHFYGDSYSNDTKWISAVLDTSKLQ